MLSVCHSRSSEDLAAHTSLNFLPASFRSRWAMRSGEQVATLEPRALLAANNGDMLCALAVQGLGVARLADHQIASERETGQWVVVLENVELDR